MRAAVFLAALILLAEAPTGDWPMWGGSPERNMVSSMAGIPDSWDVPSAKNIKWTAKLGSQSYGNPVVADGQIYAGTNNELTRDPKVTGDRGVLMCFRESDGQFLWQYTHPKLASGQANDWPETGVCSSPLVEAGRVYYVSNRCELISLDTQGKLVWSFDMLKELGSHPHNQSSSSPASYGDLIYANTSNGRDESHEKLPNPKAPTLIAVNKKTGKLVWQANHAGANVLDGQWSSPAIGVINGVPQVVMGEGDGFVRSYEPLTGKLLWAFDTNPKDAVWPKTRNIIIATPTIWQNKVYIANGQDPESGAGPGHLYALNEKGAVWHYDKIKRSLSSAAIANGLLFIADLSGYLHCLDANTGAPYWTHDLLSAIWATPVIVNGKVYLGDEDGDIFVFAAAKEKKQLGQFNMGSNVFSSAVPAHGKLFVMNRNQLFAIGQKP